MHDGAIQTRVRRASVVVVRCIRVVIDRFRSAKTVTNDDFAVPRQLHCGVRGCFLTQVKCLARIGYAGAFRTLIFDDAGALFTSYALHAFALAITHGGSIGCTWHARRGILSPTKPLDAFVGDTRDSRF
jgi:hypothetical protein